MLGFTLLLFKTHAVLVVDHFLLTAPVFVRSLNLHPLMVHLHLGLFHLHLHLRFLVFHLHAHFERALFVLEFHLGKPGLALFLSLLRRRIPLGLGLIDLHPTLVVLRVERSR